MRVKLPAAGVPPDFCRNVIPGAWIAPVFSGHPRHWGIMVAPMKTVLDLCDDLERVEFSRGESLLQAGARSGNLYILVSGQLEVAQGDTVITRLSAPGSIVGEISVLLDLPHQADVRAATDVVCRVTRGGRDFLASRPELALLVAELLARRLKGMLGYLADLKAQYADRDDHLGMVDEVLLNLAHWVPKKTGER
jgi:CRP/FNR family transcriptional regulator, cyclic AMP receptor protein